MFVPTIQFCSKVIRKCDGFTCPHWKGNSQKTCLSVKYLVDSNLLLLCALLCYDYQSFKVVTEIPKSAFSGTMVSEYL